MVTADVIQTFYGLSTDQKPTDVKNGSIFIEINTGKSYMYSASNNTWYEI